MYNLEIGRLGATLVTVLLSVGYCTVSSVAAPPRHNTRPALTIFGEHR